MTTTHTSERFGACPVCESHGIMGRLCPEPVCSRRGYRMVPTEYLPGNDELVDPMVGQALGDYLLVSLLGAGGFGKVYLALQLPIGLEAAVKLLDLEWIPESSHEPLIARFEAEARALALLRHPNVVRLLHYGSFRKRPYLVMEYVGEATTLEQEIFDRAGRGERFALWEISSVVGQILDGLAAAHEQGVIHRDIKPGNIMLQRAHGHPLLVRLLDFGLAKFLAGGSLTEAATGTPDYMAPEQIAKGEIGPFTDLFAAGSIAFELLTGNRPFPGEDVQQTIFFKMSSDFDPLAAVADPALPPAAADFLRRALAWNPGERYRSVEAFRLGFSGAVGAIETQGGSLLANVSLDGLSRGSSGADEAARAPTVRAMKSRPSPEDALRRWLASEGSRLELTGPEEDAE